MAKTVEEIKNTEYRFDTLVKKDHKFGGNDLVLGRILGFKEMICDGIHDGHHEPTWGMKPTEEGRIIRTVCTPDKYVEFADRVKMHYPDLCLFNYGGVDITE